MMAVQRQLEKLLTPREVAAWLGVSEQWVRRHARGDRRPHLPAVRLGKLLRFRASEIEDWLRRQGIAA
jgi:excisionase family DNA binding protein